MVKFRTFVIATFGLFLAVTSWAAPQQLKIVDVSRSWSFFSWADYNGRNERGEKALQIHLMRYRTGVVLACYRIQVPGEPGQYLAKQCLDQAASQSFFQKLEPAHADRAAVQLEFDDQTGLLLN